MTPADAPVGSRLRTPAGEVWLRIADGRWVAHPRLAERRSIAQAVAAALAAEPGEWTVATLADDLGVSARSVRTALEGVPHEHRRHGRGLGSGVYLFPAGHPTREAEALALVARGPTTAEAVAEALGVSRCYAAIVLRRAGAVMRRAGQGAVWVAR